MAASPFSFHCMICFEEFHPDDRYPVVLPCGHTYVCNVCADRLDKCMECRTLLYVSAPRPPHQQQQQPQGHYQPATSAWASARASRLGPSQTNQPPPPPPVKTRLPLPKNVVLLSLIEATELATQDAEKALSPTSPMVKQNAFQIDEDKKEEDEEEEKIRAATSLALSVSGTYAVANKKGLAIYPSRPTSFTMERSTTGMGEEDVDALVRFFHLDHKLDIESSSFGDESSLKRTDTREEPPAHLSYGDRVQIVSVDGDWAKLSRGYGFVRASRHDLVKVGGPLDRACKLEAMLRSLSLRRRELRREQNQVDNRFVRLMNDLQTSLLNDEDLTVVAGEAFTPTPKGGKDEKENEMVLREVEPTQREERRDPTNEGLMKPSNLTRQSTPTPAARNFSCFANDVFDALGGAPDDEVVSAGPAIFNAMTHPFGSAIERTATTSSEDDRNSSLFPAASHPSPSAISAGARAWRERHGREANQEVDFRTGLSGHLALTSSHGYTHEYLSRKTAIPRMSSHSGLSMTRPVRRVVAPAPEFGTPPREIAERKESQSFDRTGSM